MNCTSPELLLHKLWTEKHEADWCKWKAEAQQRHHWQHDWGVFFRLHSFLDMQYQKIFIDPYTNTKWFLYFWVIMSLPRVHYYQKLPKFWKRAGFFHVCKLMKLVLKSGGCKILCCHVACVDNVDLSRAPIIMYCTYHAGITVLVTDVES